MRREIQAKDGALKSASIRHDGHMFGSGLYVFLKKRHSTLLY